MGGDRRDYPVALAAQRDVGGRRSYPPRRRHRIRLITASSQPGRFASGVDTAHLRRRREQGTDAQHHRKHDGSERDRRLNRYRTPIVTEMRCTTVV